MSEADVKCNCGECGVELEESPSLPHESRMPCPACGSITRAIQVSISESIVVREKLGMKGKRAGEKKSYIESISGDDLHRKTGKWMKLSRLIDRENNVYKEEVKDPATGDIVHRCEEPLSDHKGHGSAKRPKS